MEVFESQLRRVGSSLGVLIPKRVIDEIRGHEGDVIELAVLPAAGRRQKFLAGLAGTLRGAPPFERERNDRF